MTKSVVNLSVIPSHDLVVVRLGLTQNEDDWDQQAFLLDILEAIRR